MQSLRRCLRWTCQGLGRGGRNSWIWVTRVWQRLWLCVFPPDPATVPNVSISFWCDVPSHRYWYRIAGATLSQCEIARSALEFHRRIEKGLEGKNVRVEMDTPARSLAVRILIVINNKRELRNELSLHQGLSALVLAYPEGIAAGDVFRAELALDGIVTLCCRRKDRELPPQLVGRVPVEGAPTLH